MKKIGIIGGLGPLASTRFLGTIYGKGKYYSEQEMPSIVLFSDSRYPDRTEAFLTGQGGIIAKLLIRDIKYLLEMDCQTIVICCFTAHLALSLIPTLLKQRILSLLDVAISQISNTKGITLIACTNGSRKMKLFESHPAWGKVASKCIFLSEKDQNILHKKIYELKTQRDPQKLDAYLQRLQPKYNFNNVLCGCTELHLIAAARRSDPVRLSKLIYIDPLDTCAAMIAADNLKTLL